VRGGWALCALVIAGGALAQVQPMFEVAKVASAGKPYRVRAWRTPERLEFSAAQAADIIGFAYGFPADRVDRRPQWMYNDYFDVAVTTPSAATLAEQKVLLQKLLEERFGLVMHRVSREGPAYYMMAGPNVKLTASTEGEEVLYPEFRTRLPEPTKTPRSGPMRLICTAKHVSMSDVATWMYSLVKMPVSDETRITGFFDLEIPGMPINSNGDVAIEAVRNTLGLEFELKKEPVETLIIDGSREPGGN